MHAKPFFIATALTIGLMAAGLTRADQATTPTPVVASTVLEETITGYTAICKTVTGDLDTMPAENTALMTHIVAKSILFNGAPVVLFDLGADGKPTKQSWRICVRTRLVPDVPSMKPDAPYVESVISDIKGLSTTCAKDPPGPGLCEETLAQALDAQGLVPIGAPRVTEFTDGGGAQKLKYWVPYSLVH